ncbi:LacI family DNA-binding transcriptional regulator [Streptomyces sp. CB01881]|uniref:LacI family DNA-binding transcriptional regulator n=1 Tax=Streptomyces sp. CB01881 TaxID=2078691 RepID=UPI000CDC8DAC|nr:LacI family DNA-binding transcriptional regulator [Streptomyces sp. CB01881]AUY47627.1 LacI family transcriptional regulator [Streptomyces sp. CB01881]TYC76099.1 LacI family transcriptional regulator [Streptomyces sp. CB01881]
MNDVAAAAGVGLKTVSRVVNGESGVTPDTAERVRAAIAELGFRRNDSARLLRTGRTASIALLLEDIGDPFSSALSRAVEVVAAGQGCLLFTGSSGENPDRERELALAFCARRVDGLLVVPAGDDHGYLLPETASGTPVVFLDRPAAGLDADAVLSDNAGGAREGVRHLIRHGHRRIGFVGDLPHIHTSAERLRGYRAAMAEAGLPVDERWIATGPTDRSTVARAVTTLTTGPEPVTALFTGNNRITAAALHHLPADAGRPALVGFDDLELAELLAPGLTVVAQDPAALGTTAARMLFERMGRDLGPGRRVEIPTRLIVRGSGELPPPGDRPA